MTALSHLVRIRAGLTGLCVAICLPVIATAGQLDIEQRDSQQVAAALADHVEAIIATMQVERERLEIRINRCEGARGEMRDDVYAVWAGVRLVAEQDDADRVLFAVLDDWREQGWEITRNRVLDNGGVNIASVEPVAGNSHSFDSGFQPHPGRYIVGYFSSPCFRDPSGAPSFGPVEVK
jgi:hypothetical protein